MTSSGYKAEAKKALSGNWVKVGLTVALYSILCTLATNIANGVTTMKVVMSNSGMLKGFKGGTDDIRNLSDMIKRISDATSSVATITSVINVLVQSLLIVGFFTFMINVLRRNNVDISDIFGGVRYWLKALGLILLVGIYTFLWTLLFVIPGIVKGFSYSMSLYIFAQNPEKGINQCIAESQEMMKGRKWNLFCLYFSFFGWYLLIGVAALIPLVNIVALIVAPYVIQTYVQTAVTAFYLDVSGQLGMNTNENEGYY